MVARSDTSLRHRVTVLLSSKNGEVLSTPEIHKELGGKDPYQSLGAILSKLTATGDIKRSTEYQGCYFIPRDPVSPETFPEPEVPLVDLNKPADPEVETTETIVSEKIDGTARKPGQEEAIILGVMKGLKDERDEALLRTMELEEVISHQEQQLRSQSELIKELQGKLTGSEVSALEKIRDIISHMIELRKPEETEETQSPEDAQSPEETQSPLQ